MPDIDQVPSSVATQKGESKETELIFANARPIADQLVTGLEQVNSTAGMGKIALASLRLMLADAKTRSAVLNASREDTDLTTLHHLVQNKAPLSLVKLALKSGADANAVARPVSGPCRGRSWVTPLHMAAMYANVEQIEPIAKAMKNIDQLDSSGQSALTALISQRGAFTHRDRMVIYHLQRLNADINLPFPDGGNCLTQAVISGRLEKAQLLIELGANFQKVGDQVWQKLMETMRDNCWHSARALDWQTLESRLKALCSLQSVLGTEALGYILSSQRTDEPMPLHYAAAHNAPPEIIRLLVSMGAPVNQTCALELTFTNKVETRKLVTPAHLASYAKSAESLDVLGEFGANFEARDSFGETPVFMPVRSPHDKSIKPVLDFYVNKSVDVNSLNDSGQSCTAVSAICGNFEHMRTMQSLGGVVQGLKPQEVKGIAGKLLTKVCDEVKAKDWEKVRKHFELLWELSCNTPEVLADLMNHRLVDTRNGKTKNTVTFLQLLIEAGATEDILSRAISYGADPKYVFGSKAVGKVHSALNELIEELHQSPELEKKGPKMARGATYMHLAACHGNLAACRVLHRLGLRIDQRDENGSTPFLHAIIDGRYKELYRPIQRGSDGRTQYIAEEESQRERMTAVVDFLISHGADLGVRNKSGQDFFSVLAFERTNDSTSRLLIDQIMEAVSASYKGRLTYHVDGNRETTAVIAEMQKLLTSLSLKAPERPMFPFGSGTSEEDNLHTPVKNILTTSKGNLRLAAEYLEGIQEALFNAAHTDGTKLTRLMPFIHAKGQPGMLTHLAKELEFGDVHKQVSRYHPNEVELMAMLNHPKDPARKGSHIDRITGGLSRIYEYMYPTASGALSGTSADLFTMLGFVSGHGQSREITDLTAWNWGRIGTLSLSFSRWTFDSWSVSKVEDGQKKNILPALWQQYGAKKLPALANDKIFGTGFELSYADKPPQIFVRSSHGKEVGLEISPEALVILRRGHIIVSLPEAGTLIIRNSSNVFGRDTLKHPAYWSHGSIGEAFTKEDLLNLDPAWVDQHFMDVLRADINDRGSRAQINMQKLLITLDGVFQDYAAWKFDTRLKTAWEDLTDVGLGNQLKGAHLSKGFAAVVQYLEELLNLQAETDQKVLIPELALMHPAFTPWSSFPFKNSKGQLQDTFKVTMENVGVLSALANGDYSEQDLKDTDLRSFIQTALNSNAELVLVRPADQH